MQQTHLCSLFAVCKLHSCRLKLYNCYSAYTICTSSCLALLNDLGDTGIAGTNSQKCCQLFEIQSTRTPEKEQWICVFCVLCMLYGYIWLQKWLLHWDKHSSRERIVFAGHLSVILYLYMDKMRPVGLQPHPVEGPAGYSVMVRQTLNEDLSQIQRKFL